MLVIFINSISILKFGILFFISRCTSLIKIFVVIQKYKAVDAHVYIVTESHGGVESVIQPFEITQKCFI